MSLLLLFNMKLAVYCNMPARWQIICAFSCRPASLIQQRLWWQSLALICIRLYTGVIYGIELFQICTKHAEIFVKNSFLRMIREK